MASPGNRHCSIKNPSPKLSWCQFEKPKEAKVHHFGGQTQPYFFFFVTNYMIPQTFTVTSSIGCFYLLVFLFFFTVFSCRFRAVD